MERSNRHERLHSAIEVKCLMTKSGTKPIMFLLSVILHGLLFTLTANSAMHKQAFLQRSTSWSFFGRKRLNTHNHRR